MSAIRKLRSQLRQSLHQHLMHLYQSYREMYDQEQSSAFIIEALKEQLAYFTTNSVEELSVNDHLDQLETRYKKHLKSSDPDLRALATDTIMSIQQVRNARALEEELLNESKRS